MPEYIIPVLQKRTIDFSGIASGTSLTSVLAERIDVTPWRELAVAVRVHDHTLTGGVGIIHVKGMAQSWTPEDPSMDFLGPDSFDAVLDANTPIPALLSYSVSMTQSSSCFLPFGRLVAIGSKTGAGTMTASVSVEFSVKDD